VRTTEDIVEKLAAAARVLPASTSVYIEDDFVMNLLETVLDYLLQTEVVVRALERFRENRWKEIMTLDDLAQVMERFPDDQTGNTVEAPCRPSEGTAAPPSCSHRTSAWLTNRSGCAPVKTTAWTLGSRSTRSTNSSSWLAISRTNCEGRHRPGRSALLRDPRSRRGPCLLVPLLVSRGPPSVVTANVAAVPGLPWRLWSVGAMTFAGRGSACSGLVEHRGRLCRGEK
jgi:hypothetical protein